MIMYYACAATDGSLHSNVPVAGFSMEIEKLTMSQNALIEVCGNQQRGDS